MKERCNDIMHYSDRREGFEESVTYCKNVVTNERFFTTLREFWLLELILNKDYKCWLGVEDVTEEEIRAEIKEITTYKRISEVLEEHKLEGEYKFILTNTSIYLIKEKSIGRIVHYPEYDSVQTERILSVCPSSVIIKTPQESDMYIEDLFFSYYKYNDSDSANRLYYDLINYDKVFISTPLKKDCYYLILEDDTVLFKLSDDEIQHISLKDFLKMVLSKQNEYYFCYDCIPDKESYALQAYDYKLNRQKEKDCAVADNLQKK